MFWTILVYQTVRIRYGAFCSKWQCLRNRLACFVLFCLSEIIFNTPTVLVKWTDRKIRAYVPACLYNSWFELFQYTDNVRSYPGSCIIETCAVWQSVYPAVRPHAYSTIWVYTIRSEKYAYGLNTSDRSIIIDDQFILVKISIIVFIFQYWLNRN